MSLRTRQRVFQRVFLSLVIAVFMISVIIQEAHACTSSPEMPWFTPSLSVISTDLPTGAAELKSAGDTLLLQNDSANPIRVVISSRYQEKMGYYELSMGQSAPLQVTYSDELVIDSYLVTNLDSRNVMGDDRPTDVKVPGSQLATAHLIINEQSYFIQLQISYALNPDYQPVTILALDSSCESPLSSFFVQFTSPTTGFACILSLVVVFGIIVFGRLRKRNSKIESSSSKN